MLEIYDIYTIPFSIQAVEKIKKINKQRDYNANPTNYNNYGAEFNTTWVGLAGELAFKHFLDLNPVEYRYYSDIRTKDIVDFDVYSLNIDVKTSSCKTEPQLYWNCGVSEPQFDKTIEQKKVNCFLFCNYNLLTNEASVLGFLHISDFQKLAKFTPQGTKRGSIELSVGDYSVKTYDLRPLNDLPKFR